MSVRSCKLCKCVLLYLRSLVYSVSIHHAMFVDTTGVGHADDEPFVFGVPFDNNPFLSELLASNWTDLDRHVSDHVMTMRTNFAKQG